jgi:hypothetical protein
VLVDVLLQKADDMFPEGLGRPRAFKRDGAAADKTNELLESASTAIEKLFKQRGYDPKQPELVKKRLGYALDQYEASAYLVAGALHLPLLSPPEAKTIGKRINNIIGKSGSILLASRCASAAALLRRRWRRCCRRSRRSTWHRRRRSASGYLLQRRPRRRRCRHHPRPSLRLCPRPSASQHRPFACTSGMRSRRSPSRSPRWRGSRASDTRR